MTLRDSLRAAERRLSDAGVDSPALSARLLAGKALQLSVVQVLTESRRPLSDAESALFESLIARRERGEPVAYILGEREFYGLSFQVGPGVLIPRPETELLVDEARKRFDETKPLRFMDLGTGSGALAVTLAHVFPHARGWAVDLSPVALDAARNNARRLGTEQRIEFVPGDFTAPLPAADLDLVVANPPYVTWAEHGELSREVADFEPRSALVSGGEQGDGLDHVRGLAPRAADALRPGGTLLVEIGWQQGETGAALLGNPALGLCDVRVLQDLAGLDRILAARKRPC